MKQVFFVAAILLMPASGSANAQSSDCKPELKVTGSARPGKASALGSAQTQWHRTAQGQHGDFYADWAFARNPRDACVSIGFALTRCEVAARPCRAATESPTQIPCDPKTDSSKCDANIKWIQSRLNAKLGINLKVDGSSGEGRNSETGKAIRKFKAQAGLKDATEADVTDDLMKALAN